MWYKVKELFDTGLNISQIRKETGLDRGTIRRYLHMDEQCFHEWIKRPRRLPKKLSEYHTFIRKRLEDQPYLSSAQIEDRLKEHFPDLPVVHSKTIYNFVKCIREQYKLPKDTAIGIKQKEALDILQQLHDERHITLKWVEGRGKLCFIKAAHVNDEVN